MRTILMIFAFSLFCSGTVGNREARASVGGKDKDLESTPAARIQTNSSPEAETGAVNVKEVEELDGILYRTGSDQPFTGTIIQKDEEGRLVATAVYRDGLKNGPTTHWYSRLEKKKSVVHYKDGIKDGKWIAWSRNGWIDWESTYLDGKRVLGQDIIRSGRLVFNQKTGLFYELNMYPTPYTGRVITYSRTGDKKVREASYREGKLHGKSVEWRPDGKKMNEVVYSEGEVISEADYFDHGEIKSRIEYPEPDLKIATFYYKDGTPETRTWFRKEKTVKKKQWDRAGEPIMDVSRTEDGQWIDHLEPDKN